MERRTSPTSKYGYTEMAKSVAPTTAFTNRPFKGYRCDDRGVDGGGGGGGGGGSLADQVYDLSAMLGRLRTRVDRAQELLRTASQVCINVGR